MDSDTGWRIAVLVGLLGLSAFFSSSETALMAFSRIRLRRLADSGDPPAKRISKLVESPARLLTTILIGNNLINTAITAIATALVLRWVVDEETALLLSTLTATTAILILGEITPKALAASSPETVARFVHRPIGALVWLMAPVNRVFAAATDLLLRLTGRGRRHEPPVTEDDVRTLLTLGRQQGVFAPEEQRMVERIFAFGDLRVRDVMVPRVDVVGISREITWPELLARVRQEHFTRYPVYDGDLDHIIGILHVKELMIEAARRQPDAAASHAQLAAHPGRQQPAATGITAPGSGGAGGPPLPEHFDITRFIRPAYFIPESKRVVELLREMRQRRAHMAVVVDEFGGTAGIVTIEDLLEEVVGDISDEFDHREPPIRRLDERTFSAAGSVRLEELNEHLSLRLACEEADTIAGLVMAVLGRIPAPGDRVTQDGVEMVVERMDGQRIERLLIRLPEPLPTERSANSGVAGRHDPGPGQDGSSRSSAATPRKEALRAS